MELSLSATGEVIVRGNPIYAALLNEKVYIEYDGMERGITQDLFAQDIVEQDIILAFLLDAQLTAV
jgi:XisI protein